MNQEGSRFWDTLSKPEKGKVTSNVPSQPTHPWTTFDHVCPVSKMRYQLPAVSYQLIPSRNP